MHVDERHEYKSNYLTFMFNGADVVEFDNIEVLEDVEVGERYYPEIFKSQGGYATAIAREQPLWWRFTVRLHTPETIRKLNKIVAWTSTRYVCTGWLNGWRDVKINGPGLTPAQLLKMELVFEYDKEIMFHAIKQGLGIRKDVEVKIRVYEAGGTKKPGNIGIVVTDPKPVGISTLETGGVASGNRTSGLYIGHLMDDPNDSNERVMISSADENGKVTTQELEQVNGWVEITNETRATGLIELANGSKVSVPALLGSGSGSNVTPTKGGGIVLDTTFDAALEPTRGIE